MTQLREEIRATTMEEGVATFFVTINPSDTNNPIAQIFAGKECSLEHILSNPKEGNGYARACAIANNPVAGAQFFDHTITNLLKYLVGDTAPGGKPGLFGKARAYYGVVEAQSRGSLHLHIEIWIEGALSPSKMREKAAADPEWRKQLINYYESIIHHDFPDTVEKDFIPTVSPVLRTMVPTSTPDYESARDQDLYDLLRVTGQVHTHGFTCFKYLPHSVSALRDDDRDCRFNLPAPIIEKSYFDEATGRIELKRTNGSMNGYNPTVSGAEEEGSDGEDEDEDEDEHDPSNELLSLGDRLRLNVNSSSAALEAVPITTIIEDYVYRSDQLESYCLWDFVAQVEKVKKGVNYKATAADLLFSSLHSQHKTHMLQMRRKGRVTPVPIGAKTPRKDAGSDEYYAYMLCLFSPWRRVAQVSIDWKQQFEEFEKIVDPRLAEIIENSQAFYQCRDAADDWGAQRKANVAELRLKAKEQDYVAPKELTEFDVELELMNEGEIELDDEEIEAAYIRRESLKLNPGQLCFLLAGPGGTGKSRIFDAIKEFYTRVGFPGGLKVTAPTGVAAVNIGGSTIHSEASLMVKKVNHADLQERWEGTKTLLVDEISMVGSPLLGELAINLKIAQGDASIDHLPFAGYNVILAGDVAQLQPVKQVSLFAKDLIQEYTALNPLNKATLPKLIGFSAWRQVEKVVMLDEIHRQKDPIFIDILQHARFGLCTSEHINILKKRLVQNLPIDERQNLYGIERWAEFDEEGQTLGCPLITGSNTARDAHNIQSMKAFALATGQEYHEYVAKDTSNRKPLLATIRRSALAAPAKQASDLMGRLPLVVGAPYFVTYNLATELGICNGAEARLIFQASLMAKIRPFLTECESNQFEVKSNIESLTRNYKNVRSKAKNTLDNGCKFHSYQLLHSHPTIRKDVR
ncbi:hypothetical protein JCM5353_003876 [Sporobolomyces roseus]